MRPEQFERVRQLFDTLVDAPESERVGLLERDCPDDPAVRAEVERLLRDEIRGSHGTTRLRRNLDRAIGRQAASVDTERRPGQVISHYRLEQFLGAGGMGEVWRAADLALGRTSAVKLLRPEFGDTLRLRLLREAEASARLHHPGIAAFYESGETAGLTWLAMEYVTGQTLRNRLEQGPLPADEALVLGATLLEALVHAHAAGVLHRDLKPANVMLNEDGATKLLDFGLAMWVVEPSTTPDDSRTLTLATQLTAHGAILGTVGYMSPEQVRGEPLDARTDVFSVGALLYEALTGRPAFPGKGRMERMAAVLSRDPEPLAATGVPDGVAEVLQRALAREVSERYPSASAFLSDLRRVSEGRAVARLPHTLAVFDLENLSRNERDDWIGSGMAESLAADLGRIAGLKVVARERVVGAWAQAAAEGGEAADALQIGRRLACRWILGGSFQRMGPALRVTARLVDVGTGEVVTSQKTDGKVEEIFAIEDRLSDGVAEVLNLTAASARSVPELDAYECYARGKRLIDRLGQGTMEEAAEFLQRAIELDPDYVPALVRLAAMHALRFVYTVDPALLDTAADYARRALHRDPNNAWAHAWLGYALWRQGRIEDGLREQRCAIEVDADDYLPQYFAACCLFNLGRYGEAVPHAQKATEQDSPIHSWVFAVLGMSHLALGHAAEARWSLEKSDEVSHASGQSPSPFAVTALWHRYFGDLGEARRLALEYLDEIQSIEHVYHDHMRSGTLCLLGQIAVDQGDLAAACASFDQCVAQIRGRPRALGSGYDLVQALAGQTCAGAGAEPFEEACRLMERRDQFNFCWVGHASDDVTWLQLSRAATALGRDGQARELLERARAAGLTPTLEGRP